MLCSGDELLSPRRSIIASRELNCRVRNETGCDPSDESPEHNMRLYIIIVSALKKISKKLTSRKHGIRRHFPNKKSMCNTPRGIKPRLAQEETRQRISTPRLNASLRFHLVPINLIISEEFQTIPHLEVGFPLRCFQRLSIPNIATRPCSWRNNRYTRG